MELTLLLYVCVAQTYEPNPVGAGRFRIANMRLTGTVLLFVLSDFGKPDRQNWMQK